MLASVCHDGLINGPRIHWRDLIKGPVWPLGQQMLRLAGLIKPRGAASSPLGSLSLTAWGPSRGGSQVGHGVLSPVGSDLLMGLGGGTVGSRVTLPGFKPESHTYLTV